jgi:tetratricopeptide (TPR) repeat protein
MGFLRKWYRDSVAEPKERAQMFLADGEYAEAASDFRRCGMYWEAAEAYMKVAEKVTDDQIRGEKYYYYNQAAENYEKAGHYEQMRKAYERGWRRSETADVKRLAAHNQLEEFCRNVRDHDPASLASRLQHANEWKLAGDLYRTASERAEDTTESYYDNKYHMFYQAIESYKKAGISDEELLALHEELIKLDVDHAFRHDPMDWVIRSRHLSQFVENVVHDVPMYLWRALFDQPYANKEAAAMDREGIARGMLRCVRVASSADRSGQVLSDELCRDASGMPCREATARYLKGVGDYTEAAEMYLAQAELIPEGDLLKDATKCYRKASQPLKAAEILERLGKYKEAAGLAEDAGNKKLAIRLYEQALKEEGVSDSEADWIKATLQRLRKEREKPSAIGPVQPEDYM